jgi:hypothetical protein
MRDLLVHLYQVLTTDPQLTTLIPLDNIGAAIRQNAELDSLEYWTEGDSADASRHRSASLILRVNSISGVDHALQVTDRLERLLTASTLTPDPPVTFKVSQVRLIDSRNVEITDRICIRAVEFRLRFIDLRPPTQKQ